MDVVDRGIEEEIDPFEELDADSQLQYLIGRVMSTEETEEYISGDNSVPMCAEYDDETWEDSFFAGIGESLHILNKEEEKEEEEENETFERVQIPPRIKEAVQA